MADSTLYPQAEVDALVGHIGRQAGQLRKVLEEADQLARAGEVAGYESAWRVLRRGVLEMLGKGEAVRDLTEAEIVEIQNRLHERYSPRPGETWATAAEAVGRLGAHVFIACSDANRHGQPDRLTRDELELLLKLLKRMNDAG